MDGTAEQLHSPATAARQGDPLQCITQSEVMRLTGYSRVTLWRMREVGTFPRPLPGFRLRWRRGAVLDWMRRSEVEQAATEAIVEQMSEV